MKNKLRAIISTDPFLYYTWFKIYRSKRGLKIKWFNSQSKIFFDGYPRSGNTYLSHLMRGLYDDKNMLHHFHTVAPLKIALKKQIKSIVIIRDPIESISSNYLKKHELTVLPDKTDLGLLNMMLNDYKVYHKYIAKNLSKVHIVNFELLITKPELTLLAIDKYLDNYSNIKDDNDLINLIGKRKKIKFGAKSTLGSSLPSIQKEEMKSIIKIELKKLIEFEEAQKLFIDILSQKI